ncbi:CDP-glycerol glycerophosphotransferase family protein [[Clostridium] polysaccharolyticum]|uniref:CDP-ribitol ribitolphosphotransferase n=1 Tax=[Clostridium] polysaccharolyticum TaxID=29364 RepID=A0A1H9ZDA2_9FIRM|nr:CDP-glycerol glycerophosphotransferase family protein [[Clostridium] polysaccharolyticum]SES79598.1 CDP-ribitol ribitolphosphotransferase [[Clostridium] polysaccharolyticum]
MKKKIGYWIYAIFFYFFRLFPRKKNKVFCVMTHDGSPGSSVGVVVEALKKQFPKYQYIYMKKSDREGVKKHVIKSFFGFFLAKPYHMATASYVLLDNVFLPMAYLKFHKDVKVIQLWHGTGTIKKFGQDANAGEVKRLEFLANQSITHLIVNSEYTKKQYAQAFGVDLSKVFVLGLPRTDEMFSEEIKNRKQNEFYAEYPDLKGKRIVLYAPTFRDQEVDAPKMELDIQYLREHTDEQTIFLIKLHPFVAKNYKTDDSERFINVSDYQDINTLLFVSDILITDYSSIIFEYSVLERPMIFFAYDLECFSKNGRGFYEEYLSYVPGPVVYSNKELVQKLNENTFDYEKVIEFKKGSFAYLDGKSLERLISQVFKA